MKSLKFLAVGMLAFVSACGAQNSSELAAIPSKSDGSILGADGNLMINALVQVGVKRENPRAVGALTLKAKEVTCSRPVVPHPIPGCRVTQTDGKVLIAKQAEAQTIIDVLSRHGALVRDGRVGAAVFTALNLECHRVVVPNAVGTCGFTPKH